MNDQLYSDLLQNLSEVERDIKEFIIETVQQEGGISLNLTQEESENDRNYPITTTLYGEYDTPRIKLTDVYLDEQMNIYADGIDAETGEKRSQFYIYSEQYADIFYFIGEVVIDCPNHD